MNEKNIDSEPDELRSGGFLDPCLFYENKPKMVENNSISVAIPLRKVKDISKYLDLEAINQGKIDPVTLHRKVRGYKPWGA